ncbi:MAG: beta-ketoacyl-ACP synthase II [Salinivirgaceae bacterium]|jgi:3-oxoacyl-[acyl-carrier-protein] synthase II|nr:beta-ketoacyl-ACP synthase II [Salinivirgaceae bacterium]
MNIRRVVVTGMGTINPIGKNVADTWENMVNGVSGAAPITRFDASKFKTQFACEVKDYDVKDYFDRKELRKHDLYSQFAMISVDEAIKDSAIDLDKIDLDRAGVIWGAGIGGLQTFVDEIGGWATGDGNPRFSPFFIPKMIANIAAGHISIKYNLRGPNFTTVSACASSTHAIVDAVNYIRLGYSDVMVAGGSEAAIDQAGVGGFNAMKAISTRNDDPKTASRPFDKDRDGFVMGEGGAALILEDYDHAVARGAKIYGEIVGIGLNADAHHMTAPHPEGDGARKVMMMAINDAGIKPEQIDHINTHGTSTGLGDIAEPKAIVKTFGEHAYKIALNSTKSMTGHLLGAAGALESMATIFALRDQIIPPTINQFNLDEEIDSKLHIVFNKAHKMELTYALTNNFGFGGHNATILFKKV